MPVDSEQAFEQFSKQPLVKLTGVDKASFIAGYETASDRYKRERDALAEALRMVLDETNAGMWDCLPCNNARALLSTLKD